MSDFRLQVFRAVAQRLNFTKAASELFITQPAVTKHIHELERHYKVKLFDRNGSKIRLTAAGEILLQHTEQIFALYQNLDFEMSALTQIRSGKLSIGASTTIAQYVLPPVLATFHKKFPDIKIILTVNNTELIEKALLNNEIDFGIIEGRIKNRSLKYAEFLKDELVLVAANKNMPFANEIIQPAQLTKIPLILREPGSGTLEVIIHSLKAFKIKLRDLNVEMQLSGTESIKSYLLHSETMAFLSRHSILNELQQNRLRIIEIKGLKIQRSFYFIQNQGAMDSLPDVFMKFAKHYNFR